MNLWISCPSGNELWRKGESGASHGVVAGFVVLWVRKEITSRLHLVFPSIFVPIRGNLFFCEPCVRPCLSIIQVLT
jgi:hypothetical protein